MNAPRARLDRPVGPIRRALLAVLVALAFAAPCSAQPQTIPDVVRNIEIEYVDPIKTYLIPVRDTMKRIQFLEHLREFLSPLNLPVRLRIRMLECGETNSYWAGRGEGLYLCYEWPDWVGRLAPADRTEDGLSRQEVVTGAMLQVALHELGHAMFDIYNVPVFGREEDAADQMAGFLMTQFGTPLARRLLPGAAYFWKNSDSDTWAHDTFSDEHGNPEQRAYNYLCMAYGADPTGFADIADKGLLPKARVANCLGEYRQLRNAFVKTILPHLDPTRLQEVRARQWVVFDDPK